MRLLETLCFSVLVALLTEVQQAKGNCDITSITSPAASNLNIKWTSFPGATSYYMELKVVNSSTVTPVVLQFPAATTEKLVQGLQPASLYQVTLKVYQFYYVVCISSTVARTVPAASQITLSKAISSTSITFQWSSVQGADSYVLVVEGTFHVESHNLTFTSLSGDMTGLQPAKPYNCYVYSSNAAGLGARSSVKTVNTLVQPPGVVTVTSANNNVARITWPSVSGVLLYQVSLVENNQTAVAPLTWNTTSTTLNLPNLKPCVSYTIGVSSMNMFMQPGEPVTVLYTSDSIATVTSISADYSCSNGIATISWAAVPGASSYRAVVTGSNGTSLSCTSSGTSCQISSLGCGQRYSVQITSIANCESTSNISYTFETEPCPPKNPEVFRECFSNVIIFSWSPTNNTAYYMAKSVDSDGLVNECITLYTSCYFTQTDCGKNYSFTVSSVYSDVEVCNTGQTVPVTVSTAPCLPQNIRTSAMDCLSDTLITTWDLAPGALSYTVQARGNRDDFYNCTSHGNSCMMTNVKCGQSLSVWITASNNECITDVVLADVAETVPCAPQDISLAAACGSFSIALSWLTSNDAVFYTAKAILPDSTIRSCYTMDTNCVITGLQCGQTYEAFVMATNFICNSTDSQHITVKTAPCAPVNVQAVKDCQLNTATVQWQGQQPGGSYTVLLADNEGGVLNCSTSSNNCSIPNLRCGHTYNITVKQNDTLCNSLPSTAVQLESVPCAPQQVVGVVNCSSGAMTVGWNNSVVGVNYTAMVWSGTEAPVYCNTSEPRCSVGQLDCGKSYKVAVLAARGTCQSVPSQQITVDQVPCVPTNVSVSRECGATSTGITWAPSNGAHAYIAFATDTRGQRSQCVSNGTSCNITNLACGQVYSVGVLATNDNCSSQLSQTVSLYTDPCAPTNISGMVNCSSSTASLTWTSSPNAMRYIGRLESQGDVRTCNVSSTSCQISGLLCGQRYNFSVSATCGRCAGAQAAPIQLDTAPCAPQNVSTVVGCNNNSVTVSWSPTAMSLTYTANAVWNGGPAISCSSQSTSCSLQGLQCGQQYNITVAASNGNCSGPASPMQTIQTAPCIPQNVTGRFTCGSQSLVASWDAAPGANSYITMLSTSGGIPQMCVTTNLSCVFTGLQCASQYSLSVASQNRFCNSTYSPVTTLSTGPCDTQNVTAVLQCNTSIATVMWSASAGASRYTVLAQTDGGQTLAASCSTSSTSCQLTSLTCGKTFNITVLAGDATCNSTFKPQAAVVTAPCVPTILNTSVDCTTNVALLSWSPASNAIHYIVSATSTNGHESSCVSSNFSCSLTGLECGQTYSVYATAQGQQCDSSPSTSVSVITAPCPPSMVNAYYDCRNNTAVIGWSDSDGSVTFVALLQGDGYSDSCSTTGTNCSVTSLRCGRAYNVTVQAVSSHCNSSYSQLTAIQTVPCATQNVSASWLCANNSAVVGWTPVAGVNLYSVTALGRDGDVKQCNSTTSTCQLSQMHCGQIYDITVTPYMNNCTGVRSAAFSFNTGPCAPTNLSVVLQCQGNVGTASWLPAAGADSYVASATACDGHIHTCASNSTSCSFTDLHCGGNYSVTVVTMKNGCPSDPSVAVAIRTVPCVPANVSAIVDCRTNAGNISWRGAAGAVAYNAKLVAENGRVTFCSTSGTSCAVMLDCGQNYSAAVVASTDVCNSSQSSSLQFRSAPCLPQNVTVALDCAANQLNVQWQGTSASDLYTAVASSSSGHQASCNISSSSCSILGLRCGQTYNVTVASSVSNCSIQQASVSQIQSVPCKPQNISVDLQCSSSSATVQWAPCGTAQNYTVTATDLLSGNVTCSSSNTSCVLNGLSCGRTYNVTVVSRSDQCVSKVSSIVELITAPCAPTGLNVMSTCNSNTTSVAWTPSSGVVGYYIASAEPSSGLILTCNSSSTSCDLGSLLCGQTYNVSVTAYGGGGCVGGRSLTYTLKAAPCAPQTVQFQLLSCQSGNLSVVWQPTSGALSYRADAMTFPGHLLSCYSADTSCVIPALSCGVSYDVSVVAVGDSCNSSQSIIRQASTAPCPPSNVTAELNCSNNTAAVSWSTPSVPGAVYTARALSNMASLPGVECNSTNSSCTLTGLQCGTQYNVTVTATKENCTSAPSAVYSFYTAACPAQAIQTTVGCRNSTASVSWSPGSGAVSYSATLQSSDGRTYTCNSTTTGCAVTNLPCGQTYSVTVASTGQNCSSVNSTGSPVKTAPCVPQNVSASLNCSSNIGTVSWQSSQGASLYFVMANSSNGQSTNCSSATTSCDLSSLGCGLTYTVTVMAKDSNCTSACSTAVQLQTAPCVPTLSDVVLDCSSGSALAVWSGAGSGSGGADMYSVSAVDGQGGQLSCNNTQTLSCTVMGLQCGRTYTFSVTAARSQCTSTASNTLQTRTAACPAQAIQTTMGCRNSTASVSWSPGSGAVSYSAMLQSPDGHTYTCNSTTTGCAVTNLPCGQTYSVTVAAKGQNCSCVNSTGSPVRTAPCVPQNVSASLNCSSNIGTVSWQSSQGASLYFVMANSSNGQSTNCSSATTSCDLSSLGCGLNYTVTVMAKDSNCTSACSTAVQLQTAPCVPTLSDVVLDCSSGSALAVWSGAGSGSGGADMYSVSAVDGQGGQLSCNNTQTLSCTVMGLQCGRTYTFSMTAARSQCTSTASNTLQTRTAACPAQAIQTTMGCRNSTASVSWSPGSGAVSYSAMLQSSDGHTYTCNSTTTGCAVTNLPCGQTYSVTVAATGQNCSSVNSTGSPVKTAPCVPQNVSASLNCSSNIGTVSWQSSQGASLYFVMANSSNGQSTNCSSATTSCDLSSLGCGLTYTVTVMAKDSNCTSACSTAVQLQTAPCVPTLSDVVLDCSSGSALAVWSGAGSGSGGADMYSVSAVDGQGGQLSCNNTQTLSCTVMGLQCGRTYTFSMTAARSQCTSTASNTLQTRTAACPAQAIQTTMGCRNSTASVSWSPGSGAVSYSAMLQSSDGRTYTCNSTTTGCAVTNLPCGQTYSVTVAATGQNCSSVNSTGSPVKTAPCVPQNVSASLNCSSNIGTVSWQSSQGASLYFVMANSSNGQSTNCSSATTSCDLSSLGCGLNYTVTVMAKDSNCTSACSTAVQLQTAACPAQAIQTTVGCRNSTASVSWSPGSGAVSYSAMLQSSDGRTYTCNSTTTGCAVTNLPCGQTYSVTVAATGQNCSSVNSTGSPVKTAPCVPQNVSASLNCSSNIGTVSWQSSQGASLYFVMANSSNGQSTNCSSATTSCDLSSLGCGLTYTVTVMAKDSNCTSACSAAVQLQTAPCVPTLSDVVLDCSSGSALAVWSGAGSGSGGADMYSVSAVDGQGGQLSCNNTQTLSCTVMGLQCGRTYTFSVTAARSQCTSTASNTLQTRTAACPAQAIQTTMGCRNSTASVSWSPGSGAVSYSAMLQSSDGHTYTCNSTTTGCDVTNLPCGQTYSVTVAATGQNCSSVNSTGSPVKTAPCVPQNVSASVNCSSNTATVSWQNSQGASLYFVMANSSNGQSANCTSTSTSCNLSPLACGLTYTVTVMAKDSNCTSACSAAVQLQTVPCAPSFISAVQNCTTDVATVMWAPSAGSQGYSVSAVAPLGQSASCSSSSSSTSCKLGPLSCGSAYTVSVQALGATCNSSADMSGYLITEPCVPQHLTVQYDLTIAQLFWDFTQGATSFIAQAATQQGLNTTCPETADTNCPLSGMQCGQIYNITVTAHNDACSGTGTAISDPYQLMTEPCPPQNVQARLNCSSSTASISWDTSLVAVSYVVFIDGWNGDSWASATSQTSYRIPGLSCGTRYNAHVQAVGQVYNSSDSDPVNVPTAPCVPDSASISVQVDCATDTALLSWAFSAGVDNYTAVVLGSGGHFNSCSTQQNQCNVSLLCGQSYNLTLISINQQCQIPTVINSTFQSRPCEPVGVAVNVACGMSSAVMSWQRSQGVDYYIAYAVRAGDGHKDMCNSTSSSCLFSSLACGQNYTFTVTAFTGNCSSNTSQPVYISAAPCAPSGLVAVQASGCGSAGAVLSWNASVGANLYVVNGWSKEGQTFSLSTNLSTISLSNLYCSQTYNLTVTASNQQCNSTPSLPASIQTGPCSAAAVSAVLDCVSSVAVISWQPSNGAAIYTATLLDPSGPPQSCVGVGSQCNISGLACGKNYSVAVTVSNNQCNSTTILPTSLLTAPCAPVNISVITGCANNSAVVVWDRNQGAISYYVYAVNSNDNISCQSTSSSCVLTNLTCGSTYSVRVVAVGNNCSSVPSQPVVLSSVPCQPTNVSVDIQCANGTAVLSWAAQTGAVQYFATAQSDNATSLYCQTVDTSCTLQGLQCGAMYNFTVRASSGACNSSNSKTVTAGRAPCPPGNFRVVPSVLVGQGQLLRAYWSMVNCSNSRYLLEVSGSIQSDPQALFQMSSYWTSRTYFEVPVPCSSTYRASVRGQNCGGTSAPSAVITGVSVPCPPLNINFTGSNSSAVVAWTASLYATAYYVYKVTANDQILLCNTSQLSCPVTNASSDQIMVTASNVAGTSSVHVLGARRRRDLRQTGLGELTSPQAHFTMIRAQSLRLEWTHVEGAEFYSLMIQEQSSSSKPVIKTVYGESYVISELKQATTYCVSLSARNSDSSGSYSEPVCVQTAALS